MLTPTSWTWSWNGQAPIVSSVTSYTYVQRPLGRISSLREPSVRAMPNGHAPSESIPYLTPWTWKL